MNGVNSVKYSARHTCTRVSDDFTRYSGSCESILIKANVPDCGKMLIFSISRPPPLISYINGFLVSRGHSCLVCAEDSNIDALHLENKPYSRHFVNTFLSYGLTN